MPRHLAVPALPIRGQLPQIRATIVIASVMLVSGVNVSFD
mgnify:CR=1 FL=1